MDDKQVIGFYHETEEPYGCFSNWYMSEFQYAGHTYNCVEQYMMYQKMAMFHAWDVCGKIMNSSDPKEMKVLGKTRVNGFNDSVWKNTSYTIVKKAVYAKFVQNKKLQEILLSTGNKALCECSLKDTKWGIGIDINDLSYESVRNWKGSNFLGRALMEVRDILRKNDEYIDAIDMEPIPEWNLLPGVLRSNPKYFDVVQAYALTLNQRDKDRFLFDYSFNDWDISMRTDIDRELPIAGFYEMKQEIYDLSRI